jgi:hypothetical protein
MHSGAALQLVHPRTERDLVAAEVAAAVFLRALGISLDSEGLCSVGLREAGHLLVRGVDAAQPPVTPSPPWYQPVAGSPTPKWNPSSQPHPGRMGLPAGWPVRRSRGNSETSSVMSERTD